MHKSTIKAKLAENSSGFITASENKTTNKKLPFITVVGQPNSGKTTLFNTLTGSHFKTANYPGATVEYHTGNFSEEFKFNAIVLDSPGIISIHPESPDEKVTVNALFKHPQYGLPDVVIVTTDCTQLSRQLYVVKQMIDAGFKVIVALTMYDLLEDKGFRVDIHRLQEILKTPVVIVNGRVGAGIEKLVDEVRKIYHEVIEYEVVNKITQPSLPKLNEIIELYRFTEQTETEVIKPIESSPEIEGINRKYFGSAKREPVRDTARLDKIFLHRFWGLVIFFISMGIIFTSVFWAASPLMDLVDTAFGLLSKGASNILPENTWYNDLITKGLINGVGSVMIFIPQIFILFLLLALLEDTGYLARAAMIIDKPLTRFGLNGRSFVPMISGYACAIPAILAARTINNRYERYLTIFVIPLMSCSARLPVFALLLAFVIPPSKPWIGGIAMGAIYLLSLISGSIFAGIISRFKKTGEKSTFMLELPAYRKPVLRHIIKNTLHKSFVYVKKAGPLIVFISLILWTITYFPDVSPKIDTERINGLNAEQVQRLTENQRLNNSFAAISGKFFEPLLTPLGWDWRIGVSLVSAFAAREVFVSALTITLNITDGDGDNMQSSIVSTMREAQIENSDTPLFTTASIISLIIYFMFAMQCLSTVAVARKETGSWKIPVLQIIIYTITAYMLAFIAYNGLRFIGIS
jgi:ferrous iron transport protein B